jgi:hypothetical protein
MRMAKAEAIADDRVALIYHVRVYPEGSQPYVTRATSEGGIGKERLNLDDVFVVLNAHTFNLYYREVWNQKLMLIDDVCLFDAPQFEISLAIRLYRIPDKDGNRLSDLALLKSRVKALYEFLP